MTDDYRRGRLAPSEAKDTLAYYEAVVRRGGRAVWSVTGNPLALPGALAFSLRTGAPPDRYDLVVGTFFLTDFHLEQYRPKVDKPRDELQFASAGHARYLVRGFGPPRAGEGAQVRPVTAARARFLVPLNHPGGVAFRLLGRSFVDGVVRVEWNGARVAEAPLAAGMPIDLAFTLGADQIGRGVNVVELVHEAPAAAELAVYSKLQLEERP